jgi:hypothetical protein
VGYRSARPGWSRGGSHADRGTASIGASGQPAFRNNYIQFETHTYQQTGTIEVLANGEVRVLGDTRFGAMDGMEFRASQ